jgi:hypothetical protein
MLPKEVLMRTLGVLAWVFAGAFEAEGVVALCACTDQGASKLMLNAKAI